MNRPVKWVAALSPVHEVSILGVADLGFWKQRLEPAGLLPAERTGQAQILIVGGEARFAGVRFRELSFSVLVSPQAGATWPERAYLVHAFNSCRTFAFCERVFFATPYRHSGLRVVASFPASVEVLKDGEVLFEARMRTRTAWEERKPSRCREERWEGPVFLPGRGGRKIAGGKLFFARLEGFTQTYPFLKPADSLEVKPSTDSPVLQALLDSRFVPVEWNLREQAKHAKSRTYDRATLLKELA